MCMYMYVYMYMYMYMYMCMYMYTYYVGRTCTSTCHVYMLCSCIQCTHTHAPRLTQCMLYVSWCNSRYINAHTMVDCPRQL